MVELSNLNRQILHGDDRLGKAKAASAVKTLSALNPGVHVTPFVEHLDESNIERIAGKARLAIDCLDNYATRYVLNAFCLRRGIPLVHGAIWGFMGQVTFLRPPETPCLRCIVPAASSRRDLSGAGRYRRGYRLPAGARSHQIPDGDRVRT